ncbi:MAG: hypothetical protein M5U09_16785 [Gammaproteobacteria bacterium]|nr:hypothetical protein [Gammaproteobacteria bacterium]
MADQEHGHRVIEHRGGGLEARRRLGEHRLVFFAGDLVGEHRHLDRQRGVAALEQSHAQRVDHLAPVGMDPGSVGEDHVASRIVRLGQHAEEAVAIGVEPHHLALEQVGLDLLGPALLLADVGGVQGRCRQDRGQSQDQGQGAERRELLRHCFILPPSGS